MLIKRIEKKVFRAAINQNRNYTGKIILIRAKYLTLLSNVKTFDVRAFLSPPRWIFLIDVYGVNSDICDFSFYYPIYIND